MRARVLCVDDEQNVLIGLENHLAMHYEVFSATSGADALQIVDQQGPFEVVLSDMRMPEMDGATFLERLREVSCDTIRVVLTGQADLSTAVNAVNQGRIFRFLTKPCSSEMLLASVLAAVEQNRLITAERVLLEGTLHGAVKTMTDILAYANPPAFGRAARVRNYVSALAEELKLENKWQLEIAAMLSQLICLTLPIETVETLCYAKELTTQLQAMAERLPALSSQLLDDIPRLDSVQEIIRNQDRRFDAVRASDFCSVDSATAASLLKIALDFDALESQKLSVEASLQVMCGRRGWYNPRALSVFCAQQTRVRSQDVVEEATARDLLEGMVLEEDLRDAEGTLVVPRGIEMTAWLLQKTQMFLEREAERVKSRDGQEQRLKIRKRAQPDISKPTSPETSRQTLVESSSSRAPLRSLDEPVRQFVKSLASASHEIALGSPVMANLRKLQANPELDSLQVRRLVEKNQNLAAKILHTANSASYQRREKATNLKDAIMRLGNRTVLNIAQAEAHKGYFAVLNPGYRHLLESLWEETQFVALLAREFSANRSDVDSEDVFLTGLFHNAGEVAVLRFIADQSDESPPDAAQLVQIAKLCAHYHEQAGERLLKNWKLPAAYVRIAGYHHDTRSRQGRAPLSQADCVLVHLLNAASYVAESAGSASLLRSHYGASTKEDSFEALDLSSDDIPELVNQVRALM